MAAPKGNQFAKGNPNSGRPEKEINWTLVDNLLESGCPGTEIAPHFDMHINTFYRRVEEKYNMKYTEYSQEKRQRGDSVLRAVQYAKATGSSTKGDNTMLVWLGKNRLNQRDTPEEMTVTDSINTQFEALSKQLEALQTKKAEAVIPSNE